MNTDEAEKILNDYLMNGIVKEIFFADESKALAVTIGKHSSIINSKDFGDLFGSFQNILSDRQTLSIAKLYDTPSKKYPTRSIPAMLSFIEKHSDLWSLPQKPFLKKFLIEKGFDSSIIKNLNNTSLSLSVVEYFNNSLPQISKSEICNLSSALESVREARDKVHAHNEAIDKAARKFTTWGGIELLNNYAKDFACVVGFGFLSMFIGNQSKDYLLRYDAQRLSRKLKKLLVLADLANDEN